jgi:hypothetical protein
MFVGGGCRQGGWVYCRDGGFVILGVTSPKPPAEGRLRPPEPLQMGVRDCGLFEKLDLSAARCCTSDLNWRSLKSSRETFESTQRPENR